MQNLFLNLIVLAPKTESDQHQSDVAAASANADKSESEAQSAELNEHSTFAGSQEMSICTIRCSRLILGYFT